MLFTDPTRTPYDLHFRLGRIPVRVHPTFWLFGALFGANSLNLGWEYLATWIAVFFVCILVHELGHVCMGHVFGTEGHIVLYGFGGLAYGSNDLANRWQRVAVSFAGPLAGFLLLGTVVVGAGIADPSRFRIFGEIMQIYLGFGTGISGYLFEDRPLLEFAVQRLIMFNLLWGLINLLPVWPLDGGQISRELCRWFLPRSGLRTSLGISLAVAALVTIHSVMGANGWPLVPYFPVLGMFGAILFGLLALDSFQQLQSLRRDRDYWDQGWERDPSVWRR